MAGVVADTHALLWMLDGTLPDRSRTAARSIAEALGVADRYVDLGLREIEQIGRRGNCRVAARLAALDGLHHLPDVRAATSAARSPVGALRKLIPACSPRSLSTPAEG